MASPRVFVSSTCYDLKYIRDNLKYFIKQVGYDPVLSDEGDIFYNPSQHTHDSCVSEVSNCQMFVLLIGGRFGGSFKHTDKSITNAEYDEAVRLNIPIFAMVDRSVLSEHLVYSKNKHSKHIEVGKIDYPSVDNIKIFDFVDTVRKNAINNALVPFNDYADIETYLKKQWAGMMYYYLTSESEAKRVGDMFNKLTEATQKIEFFTEQMAYKSDDKIIRVNLYIYEAILRHAKLADNLMFWRFRINPANFVKCETLDDLCSNNIIIQKRDECSITGGGPPYQLSESKYKEMIKEYTAMREEILGILDKNQIKLKDYLNEMRDFF